MEYLDVLDENGVKTGETIEREEAHRKGICHRVVHVWVMNAKNELLMQKRSKIKDWAPDMWYVSLGGHIESNEDGRQTIIREFSEELGLDVENQMDDIEYLYTFKEISVTDNGDFIDNEFYDVYLFKADLNADDLILQESEVQAVKFMPYHDFKQVVHDKAKDFVIHEEGYSMLFEYLDQKVK